MKPRAQGLAARPDKKVVRMLAPGTLTGEVARFHHSPEGRDLVRLAPSGPADAGVEPPTDELDLEHVYRRHGHDVSRWAQCLAGPGFDVEDMVHDVFLVVERRLSEFRGDARISTWLYQITVRVVQARRRLRRRRTWLWPFGEDRQSDGAEVIEIADGRASALEALERRQATSLLYRFLDELPDKYRTAVMLFELDGLSCREIAEITDVSVETVWSRVSRGREKLVQAFARWDRQKAEHAR